MVGDDLEADVLAAQAIGVTGVLVRTGKFRAEMLESSARRPDVVIESIAECYPTPVRESEPVPSPTPTP